MPDGEVNVAETYSQDWVAEQRWTNQWSSRALLCMMSEYYGMIHSFLDVGCNDGHIPMLVGRLGIPAVGLDIAAPNYDDGTVKLIKHDLSTPFDLAVKFDLVTSWEVGEHIPEDKAGVFLDSIAKHASRDVVFSAATPGQGGYYHVNEQPFEYWIDLFLERGFKILWDRTFSLRAHLKEVCGPCWWYPKNMLIFTRNEDSNSNDNG